MSWSAPPPTPPSSTPLLPQFLSPEGGEPLTLDALRTHEEWAQVPRVSMFYGIVIRMYFKEDTHPGRPHFHARHAGLQATYDIRTLEAIAGRLHPRANRLVVDWARIHQFELRRNWALVRSSQAPIPVDPLQ